MTRLLELGVAFLAGVAAALFLVDRLTGGHGPSLELSPWTEPFGDL